jgi:large subunit ribosomal protein L27
MKNVNLLLKLDLACFASKKGVGSTRNGRDSESKRLGMKLSDGQYCHCGSIIYRQRGTKIHPGLNTKRAGDDTIFATQTGIVKYVHYRRDKTRVDVVVSA